MISGTEVNEIIDSLPNGDIIRFIGNGWQPRSWTIEIIKKNVEEGNVKIENYESIQYLNKKLTEFLESEKDKV